MPANYVLLERIELNSSAASITFSNIPQTGYTDLKVVISSRQTVTNGGNGYYYDVTFNGTSANRSGRYLLNLDGSVSSSTYTLWGLSNPSDFTANTFSNCELYIPNYTSSSFKSASLDSTNENNATGIRQVLATGLWSDTAAINSITLTPGGGSFVQYSTFSLYGLAATGTTPVIAPKASGGNRIDYDGTYWIHTFNTSGTFTPQTSLTCDYLVVAGGGGGGTNYAGGGGAGGLRSTVTATGGGGSLESALSLTAQAYAITVGAGGTASSNGSNSVFSTVTSTGGGAGKGAGVAGASGGSGGGGSDGGAGGSGTANQGYAGGSGTGIGGADPAGGGGGAGAVGVNGNGGTGKAGDGGSGVSVAITGASVTYAGGGGGANYADGTIGTGQAGGGNGGASSGSQPGGNATNNTGSGGGGGGGPAGVGGLGGSGIVIIRYLAS